MQNKVQSTNKLISFSNSVSFFNPVSSFVSSFISPLFLFFLFLFSFLLSSLSPAYAANPRFGVVKPPNAKTVAVSQFVDHPALDDVREGIYLGLQEQGFIVDAINQNLSPNLFISYQNAQGDIGLASQIAVKFMSSPIDVAIGIGTPSAQTLFFQAKKIKSKIPVVFTAVTDPQSANLESGADNRPITGVTDAPPLEPLVKVMKKIQPRLYELGVIYNPAEINSVTTVERLKPLLAKAEIDLIEVTVNKTQDINSAMQQFISKVDAIYFPQDNTVVSGIGTVVKIASQNKIPLYCNDPALIDKGVLAAVGYDYKQIGILTGRVVARILSGALASSIPIVTPDSYKTAINQPLLNSYSLIRMGVEEITP